MIKIKLNEKLYDPIGGLYTIFKKTGRGQKCLKITGSQIYFESDEADVEGPELIIFLPLEKIRGENKNTIIGAFNPSAIEDLEKWHYENIDSYSSKMNQAQLTENEYKIAQKNI